MPHSHSVDGSTFLAAHVAVADARRDEYQPLRTALAALRMGPLGPGLSLEHVRGAVLQQLDIGSSASHAAVATAAGDATSSHCASGSKGVPLLSPARHAVVPYAGETQLFVIDADALAAAATSVVERDAANDGAILRWLQRCTHRGDAVWVSETELALLVRRGTRDGTSAMSNLPPMLPEVAAMLSLVSQPPSLPPAPPADDDGDAVRHVCEALLAAAAEGVDPGLEFPGVHPPWPVIRVSTTPSQRMSADATMSSPWAASLFPARHGHAVVTLFHGTSTDTAAALVKDGFRRPLCRLLPRCALAACDCQMEGFAVYFAGRAKATEYALRRAAVSGARVAALIAVSVDLGRLALARRRPCPCGCGRLFLDHAGSWYTRHGADALYVRDGSMPATRVREWAVADPARCSVLRVEEVTLGSTS